MAARWRQSWILEDFVVIGNSGAEREGKGTLEFLSADGKTVLFTLA